MEMEGSPKTKDEHPNLPSGNGGKRSILRYPLRSSSKSKDPTTDDAISSASTASKRGRPPSSLSKSVSVLSLSSNDKSSKPPRRLSIPTKSTVTPRQKPATNTTPISEPRTRRSVVNGQDNSDTPRSDVSKSSTRRKFSVLSSASYWLQQIKLSESATKHSISLGFFKLALDSGCEPLKLLREELKSYARRHNLDELGETVKDLFDSYGISETLEQLQVFETCSHVPEDEGSHSSISTAKLKPKSMNTDTQTSSTKASSKKETTQKTTTGVKTRGSENCNNVNRKLVTETGVINSIKKIVQKPGKKESTNEGYEKKQNEETVVKDVFVTKPEENEAANKENMENTRVAVAGEN